MIFFFVAFKVETLAQEKNIPQFSAFPYTMYYCRKPWFIKI